MPERVLRLATRGSPLARWQAGRVADLLAARGCRTSLVVVETDGDRRMDVPIDRLGGQGVFVKEVQAAVARGDADAAVHSAKDLPAAAAVPTGLSIAAVPERADSRDLLVGATLATLPAGARVATGSARRRAQLAGLRPDLTFQGLRGNLATRLAAARSGRIAAVVVAKAAVDRLSWRPPAGVETEILEPGVMLPQVGQGALAVECRADDDTTRSLLGAIDDPFAAAILAAERSYLATLGGGCTLPVGAHATWVPGPVEGTEPQRTGPQRTGPQRTGPPVRSATGHIELTGLLASADGRVVLRHSESGTDPQVVGHEVARYLLDEAGGSDLGDWAVGTKGRPPGADVA